MSEPVELVEYFDVSSAGPYASSVRGALIQDGSWFRVTTSTAPLSLVAAGVGVTITEPLSYDMAKQRFDAEVASKNAQGRTHSQQGSGTASLLQGTRLKAVAKQGVAITADELSFFLASNEWVLQPKISGQRVAVGIHDGRAYSYFYNGTPFLLPHAVASSLGRRALVIEAQLCGDQLFIFDLLSIDGQDMSWQSYVRRHERLSQIKSFGPAVTVLPTVNGRVAKSAFLQKMVAERCSAVVFKRANAHHLPVSVEPTQRTYMLASAPSKKTRTRPVMRRYCTSPKKPPR